MLQVKKKRNIIAHHSLIYYPETGITKLDRGKSITKEKDMIILDKKLVKEVEEKVQKLLKEINELRIKINQKRINEEKSSNTKV